MYRGWNLYAAVYQTRVLTSTWVICRSRGLVVDERSRTVRLTGGVRLALDLNKILHGERSTLIKEKS